MANFLPKVAEIVAEEVERKGKSASYFNDPVAWADYMLGVRLWSKQREIARSVVENKSVAVKAGHGVGKVLNGNTPIATPDGWVVASALKVGDRLYDEQGEITRVIGVSPVWDQRNFVIEFDDGTTIEAGENHEWDVLDLARRNRADRTKGGVGDWRDFWHTATRKTTLELYTEGLRTTANQLRWRIPLTKPLQMPEADLPVDPYLLGFWLGDGTKGSGEITIGETKKGLLDWLDAREQTYKLRSERNRGRYTVTTEGLRAALRDLGVLFDKHIPMQYLRASEHQRRELLAGIMDADGFLLKSSGGAGVGIDLTNERLADGVYDLLMTLGCKVRRSHGVAAYTLGDERHVTGTRYRMNWTPLQNPFKIRGAGWQGSNAQRSRYTQRTIVSIREVGRLQNFCIEVDSPSHLYLAGRGLIPTHNSFLVAVLICWWIDTRYPNAFVASTAPSTAQINAIVWREVRKLKSLVTKRFKEELIDHELPGYITADAQWKTDGGTILGFGRKPPDNKEDDSFQGIHDAAVLAVGDEAVGLNADLIEALSNITSNEGSRRILIANPTNPGCYFAKIFREDLGWVCHTISVLDSPNFTDEKYEMSAEALERLTGPTYVADKKKEYGEDSARFKARVLGEFANDDDYTLITQEVVEKGKACEIKPDLEKRPVLGVDVARMGTDMSVVYENNNGCIRYVDSWGKTETTETATKVHRIALEKSAEIVYVDSDGVGGGVKDQLVLLSNGLYTVIEVHGSGASPDRRQWHNFRAFMWDYFRLRMAQGQIDIDPQDESLHDELMGPRYSFNKQSGGLVIESKEDMNDRGLKSPDRADAAIYSSLNIDLDDPLLGLNKGDKIRLTPEEVMVNVPHYFTVMRQL